MEKNDDTIIVGAGPAGCSSAITVARRGYKILPLDRARFPSDKTHNQVLAGAISLIYPKHKLLWKR